MSYIAGIWGTGPLPKITINSQHRSFIIPPRPGYNFSWPGYIGMKPPPPLFGPKREKTSAFDKPLQTHLTPRKVRKSVFRKPIWS